MILMGIDASTTCTGYSIFEDKKLITHGCIKPVGENWRERLVDLGPKLAEIMEEFKPNKIVMEDVPLKKANVTALVILGAVQGIVLGVASKERVPIEFVQPSRWRSPIGLYDGTREGTKRGELKKRAVEKANDMFGLTLIWKSPTSKYNEDDIAEAILIGAYGVGITPKMKYVTP